MRVRFAPSPTGALHIGGARTALYNWLLARGSRAHPPGELVLRIEDTDRERSTPENVEQIFEALRWLELDFDGDAVFQSQRQERHAEVVRRLVAEGHAYRSTAGPQEVQAWKAEHGNERGFRGTVVDDLDAGITHVVRGADHFANTPKQMRILEAMGEEPPVYAHVPLLHGPDGKKLSKRHGAASVQELRDRGYLPEAVRNYLALLGWGYDDETTFFTTEELQRLFSLEKVSKSPAVFDEQKLRWMNGRYLRELDVDDLSRRLEAFTGHGGLRPAVEISQDKISTLSEFWPLTRFFFEGPQDDPAAREKVIEAPGAREALAHARAALADVPEPWTEDRVQLALDSVADRLGVKRKQIFQPLRVALTGTTVSPGIFETVTLLGRDETLARVDHALNGRKGS